jgi:hypothetical protein
MARRPPLPTTSEAGGFAENMRWIPVRTNQVLPAAGLPACGVVSAFGYHATNEDTTPTLRVVAPGYEDDAAMVLSTAGLQAGRSGVATDANLVLAAYVPAGLSDGFYGTRGDLPPTDPNRYKLHLANITVASRTFGPIGFRMVFGSQFKIGSVDVALFVRGLPYTSRERTGLVSAVYGAGQPDTGQRLGYGPKSLTDGWLHSHWLSPALRSTTNTEDLFAGTPAPSQPTGLAYPVWWTQTPNGSNFACIIDSPGGSAVTLSTYLSSSVATSLSFGHTPAASIGTFTQQAFVLNAGYPYVVYPSRYVVTRGLEGFCYGGDANNAGGHRYRGGLWISYTAPSSPPTVPPIVSPPVVSPAPTPSLPPPVTGTPTGTDAAIVSDLITAVNDLLAWAGTIATEQNAQNTELGFLHGWAAAVTSAARASSGYALAVTAGVAAAAAGTVTNP